VWNRLFKSFRDLLAIRWMKSRVLGYRVAEELGGASAGIAPREVSVATPVSAAAAAAR